MKKTTLAIIAMIILLMLDTSAVGYLLLTGGRQGTQGIQGTQGLQGLTGPQGKQGAPGRNGVNGSKGERGISGSSGSTGAQGPPGQPAPTNHPPIILLIDLNGSCCPDRCGHRYVFTISASINDLDNDMMHTIISYREDTLGLWMKQNEYVGAGGVCNATVSLTSHCSQKTVFWLVESWDGSDISAMTMNYTVGVET